MMCILCINVVTCFIMHALLFDAAMHVLVHVLVHV